MPLSIQGNTGVSSDLDQLVFPLRGEQGDYSSKLIELPDIARKEFGMSFYFGLFACQGLLKLGYFPFLDDRRFQVGNLDERHIVSICWIFTFFHI
ncbi:hypothetical protein BUALT_Bualt19G0109600 [Buddleja alternifolia]|uniref:Uncharacterized protein n=1 Tax=Buddleja alternifolia TaxID=168488 RepID=A0AAV6W2D5_9LAMI|nr:hypothetical protein BUALT_Bualt19G0109600 [Buddleja alternifolia]